jgi:hypothetical protein
MATQNERIAVLETKVDNLKECLTESHNKLIDQLDHVREENSKEHAKVMQLLDDLMLWKNKWVWLGGAGLTVLSLIFGHLETIVKIIQH